MKASDVFTPGRFPTYTFVDSHLKDAERLLLDAMDTGSMLVSISGPSKSGKTVFVEKLLGKENLVQVTGAGVNSPEDLWIRVFDMIGTPIKRVRTKSKGIMGRFGLRGGADWNFVIVKPKGEMSGEASIESQNTESEELAIDPLQMLIKELADTGIAVFIDDFHYIPKAAQEEIAKQIKEAIRQGVRFICASVPYHADDIIRSNPDLRGRVVAIDFDYWDGEILEGIANLGFQHLGIGCNVDMIKRMASESAGSPQLMQFLCLHACFELGVRETTENNCELPNDADFIDKICRRTALSADYSSIVEKMIEGPKIRGTERKVYLSKFGWQGDVYRFLLKAMALDPPKLNFRYQPLVDRIGTLCRGESPSGSSVTSACFHAANIGNDAARSTIVEWDGTNDVFDIRDPYFLFYIRWTEAIDG